MGGFRLKERWREKTEKKRLRYGRKDRNRGKEDDDPEHVAYGRAFRELDLKGKRPHSDVGGKKLLAGGEKEILKL